MAVYIYGHKNPDSDSVCAAIALADLKSKIGVAAVPAALGNLNLNPISFWKNLESAHPKS